MIRPSLLARCAVAFGIAAVTAVALSGCKPESREPSGRETQAAAARQAAEQVRFSGNAEIENIRRRLELTADPNLLGYIVLFNEAGSPILYEGVRGKITTNGSRLTPPDRINLRSGGSNADSQAVVRAPSDTGTYDTGNNQFIFYFNSSGQYRQWSGHYLYSTTPIRLRIEPVVVTVAPTAEAR